MTKSPDDLNDVQPKPRKPYKKGNTAPDGTYVIGKGRTPQHTRFGPGDGRPRGRRPKGQKNFDTEILEEMGRMVTLRENGKDRRVTKLRSTIIRALDNAGSKGQNPAIAAIFALSARLADKAASTMPGLTANEDELIDAFLAQRIAQLQLGDEPGDPDTEPDDDLDNDMTGPDQKLGDE